MYYKLVSQDFKNTVKIEQTVLNIINDRLSATEIADIIKIYQERQANDPNFSAQDFLLDLQGYLKYLEVEEAAPYGFVDLLRFGLATCRQKIIDEILQQYGDYQECHYGEGFSKKAYLLTDTNEIVRFYYARPSEFFYNKLLGKSEADLNKAINNNLLTVAVRNVPGQPIDIVERVIPFSKAYPILFKAKQEELLNEIDTVRNANHLITGFIEDRNANIGLAVRLDQQGQKKVYLVSLDLEPQKDKRKLPRKRLITLIEQRYLELKNKALDYEKLVQVIPELAQLSGQAIK